MELNLEIDKMGCFNCITCDCSEPMTDLNGNKALLDEIERLEKLRQETANALYDLRCEAGCGPEDAGPDVWTQLATAQAEAADLRRHLETQFIAANCANEATQRALRERDEARNSNTIWRQNVDIRAELAAAQQYLADTHERLNAECMRAGRAEGALAACDRRLQEVTADAARLREAHAATREERDQYGDERDDQFDRAERAEKERDALKEALRVAIRVAEGFMEAVRADSGKAYPWEPWEHERERLAALADKEAP